MIFDAIIIGSGFGGICQAIKLKEQNIHNFVILERASDLGGTWRDNTYPGAKCDVPFSLYSFSFAPMQGANAYLGQPAILDYLREVADEYQIAQHVRYSESVEKLIYSEQSNTWDVSTLEGKKYTSLFVISAVGQLHHPSIPKIPGSGDFEGPKIHTAQFGSRKLESSFAGKRVAVIGSGASAIQLVPELQKVCKKVHLYQRTPGYVLPKIFLLSQSQEEIVSSYPFLRKRFRQLVSATGEFLLLNTFKGKFWGLFIFKMLWRINLWFLMKDPKKRRQCIPPFPPGAKRTLFSEDFYHAADQGNVHIHSDGIDGMCNRGIIGPDKSVIEVDAIFYATGFITDTFLHGIKVTGRSNKKLWGGEKGAHAYYGVVTAGFPNLFFLWGPNTNTGSTSILLFFEDQVRFVLRAMQQVRSNSSQAIEVKAATEDQFNKRISEIGKELSFTKVKSSWYLNKGRNDKNWIGSHAEYKKGLLGIDFSRDFELHGEEDVKRSPMLANIDMDTAVGIVEDSRLTLILYRLSEVLMYAIIGANSLVLSILWFVKRRQKNNLVSHAT